MALLQSNYYLQLNVNVTLIWWRMWWITDSDQNIYFEVIGNYIFENMVDRDYEPNAECPEEVRSDNDRGGKINLLRLNPSKF